MTLTQSFSATLTAFLESEGSQKAFPLEATRSPQPELQIGPVTLSPPYCLHWTVFPGLGNVGVDLGGLGVPCTARAVSVCGNVQPGRPPLAFGPASSWIEASFSPGKQEKPVVMSPGPAPRIHSPHHLTILVLHILSESQNPRS